MKMVCGQTMSNSMHKTHHDMDFGGAHHFLLIIYFVIGDEGCIKMVKSPMILIRIIKIFKYNEFVNIQNVIR